MNDLRERFELRWQTILKKSAKLGLLLPNKEILWKKILLSFDNGFKCEYCGKQLLIKDPDFPYSRSFSLDHRISIDIGGDNKIENFAVICHRCNITKGTMTEKTFRSLLQALSKNPDILDHVFEEMWRGRLANKLERENGKEGK